MTAEAMQTAAEFVGELAGDLNKGDLELPMFSGTAVRIQRALQDEDVKIDEIVRLISSDPAIAARVLELANSAAIRGGREITDLRQAVIRMGNKIVQSSVLNFALRQVERNGGLPDGVKTTLRRIWVDSVELAARCYVIAREFTTISPNEALLAGLLSVIGRLYILLKSVEHGMADDTELEQVLSDWHPAISKAIAESWNMSDELVDALESQMETNPAVTRKGNAGRSTVCRKVAIAFQRIG